MMNSLNRLKVRSRIYLGFGIVMLLFAGVSTLAGLTIESNMRGFIGYRDLARDTNLAGELQANMLTTRLGVKDFVIDGSPSAIATVDERLAATKAFLDQAQVEIQNPQRAEMVDAITAQIDDYGRGFAEVVALQARRNEEIAILDETGPQIRERIGEVMDTAYADGDPDAAYYAGDLQEELLRARIYVQRFLLSNREADHAGAVEELAATRTALDALDAQVQNPRRRRLVAEFREGLEVYETAFENVHEIIVERNGIIEGTLDAIGPRIAGLVEDVKQSVKAEQDALGPQVVAAARRAELIDIVVSVVSLALAAAAAFFVARSIAGPVERITVAIRAIADGRLDTTIPSVDQHDEIGEMARATLVFKDNATEATRLRAKLAEEFERSVGGIVGAVSAAAKEMQANAEAMAKLAERSSEQTTSVAASAEQATVNTESVAQATQALGASIDKISRQIVEQTQMANEAANAAVQSDGQIKDLAGKAKEIGKVIEMITGIAEQTNLLALNATIEAARAGEAGKGFAVVATEVKSLANQTASATDQIASQINSVQAQINNAVEAIELINTKIKSMAEGSAAVSAAVEQQNTATQEIGRNIKKASSRTKDVSSTIDNVSEAVRQTGSGATKMLSATADLSRQASDLTTQVRGFIDGIRKNAA